MRLASAWVSLLVLPLLVLVFLALQARHALYSAGVVPRSLAARLPSRQRSYALSH
jgi:predicted branched-subunit amino acid permease